MKLARKRIHQITSIGVSAFLTLSTKSFAREAPWYLFSSPATFDAPFDPTKRGVATEGLLKVPVEDGYNFYLRVRSKTDTPYGRGEAQAFAGSRQVIAGIGVVDNPTLSIPLFLKIEEIGGEDSGLHIERKITRQPVNAWSSRDFYDFITGVVLPRGEYRIHLETLQDFALPANIEMFLNIHVPPR